LVAAANAIADGQSPRPTLGFLAPKERFGAVHHDGHVYADPRSFERFDTVASVIGGIDMRLAAKVYVALHPLLEAAYREIGAANTTLDERMARAMERIASTPLAPAGRVELVEGPVVYAYADPKLEGLSAASKHLLRMGPRNMRLVQDKVRELAAALRAEGSGAGGVIKANAEPATTAPIAPGPP
jgi:hypothetical protein